MATLLLVAGPPASSVLWVGVSDRLEALGHKTHRLELFDPVPPDPTSAGLASQIAHAAAALGPDVVLVAQGSILPAARDVAARQPLGGLVLTNGPLNRLDPVTAGICRAAATGEPFARVALQPALWQRWLASSVGLRRTTVNPYVMDRDTVVALSAPYLSSLAQRRAVAHFLADLPAALRRPSPSTVPTLIVWGDEDPLQPAHVVDTELRRIPGARFTVVPGGQHFHALERPWALAEAIHAWLPDRRSGAPAAG